MTAFFERLNAEEDPTRIATMAETMPEPPSLADVAASIAVGTAPQAAAVEPVAEAHAPGADGPTAEIDFAAAEAEAASFSGDLEADDELPAADAEPIEGDAAVEAPDTYEETHAAELVSSRIVVSGLVSVANIANFKRSLSRTSGISTIAVASGPEGDFVFTVGHTLGSALSASIRDLSGFDIEITGETDEAINVAARDRDATD
jgi:cell pole-organizing protein PopZ